MSKNLSSLLFKKKSEGTKQKTYDVDTIQKNFMQNEEKAEVEKEIPIIEPSKDEWEEGTSHNQEILNKIGDFKKGDNTKNIANMGWSFEPQAQVKKEEPEEIDEEEFSEVKDRKILNLGRKEVKKQNEPALDQEYFPELGEEGTKGNQKVSKKAAPPKKEPKATLLSKSTKETFTSAKSDSDSRPPKFMSSKKIDSVLTNPPPPVVQEQEVKEEAPQRERPAYTESQTEGLSRSKLKTTENREPREPREEKKFLPQNYGEGLVRNANRPPPQPQTEKERMAEEFQKSLNFGKKTFVNSSKGNTNLLFQKPEKKESVDSKEDSRNQQPANTNTQILPKLSGTVTEKSLQGWGV